MIKILALVFTFVCNLSFAAGPVLWGPNDISLSLQTGIQFQDVGPSVLTGSVDPTLTPISGEVGSIYMSTLTGGLYVKQDSGSSTNWVNVLTTLTGWQLTGNSGTVAGTNFLGTTDSVDLVLKADNTERVRAEADGQITLTPDQMQVVGNITSVASTYNTLYMGQQLLGPVPNQLIGPSMSPGISSTISGSYIGYLEQSQWNPGSYTPGYTGLFIGTNALEGSTIGNPTGVNVNGTFQKDTLLGSSLTGVNVNPQIQSEMTFYNGFYSNPTITVPAQNWNGFVEGSNFQAGSVVQLYKGIQVQPGIPANVSITSFVGMAISPNISLDSSMNDYSGYQNTVTIDNNVNSYQAFFTSAYGTGHITSLSELNVGTSRTGTVENYTGLNLNPTISGTINNFNGINISPTVAVTNFAAISVNNGSVVTTNQKTGLSISDGGINQGVNYDTSIYPASPGFVTGNNMGLALTVANGFPMSGTGVLGNNLGSNFLFQDNMGPDGFGGIIGAASVAFVGQLGVDPGYTVDKVNMALSGSQVIPGSGGDVTNLNFYDAVGLLNAGGTINAVSMTAFHAEPSLCQFGSNCWGVKVDSTSASNYLANNLVVGGSTGLPQNANVGIEISSTDKSFLNSRMTTGERDSLLPVVGMQIYNTDSFDLECYNGTFWGSCGTGGSITSVGIAGSPQLYGAITFNAGTNIQLTQVGQNITISSTASGGGVSNAIQTITSNYTVLNTDYNILADTALGAISVTAFSVTNTGSSFCVKLIGNNPVTVASSALIDGDGTFIITNRNAANCFTSNGSTFYVY